LIEVDISVLLTSSIVLSRFLRALACLITSLHTCVDSVIAQLISLQAGGDGFVKSLDGQIEMEHPNKLIDSFTGVIELNEFGRESILAGNIILRGCVVRNTDWVIGCIINTGHDTKIMMSAAKTPSKSSNIEVMASVEVLRMMILLVVICFIGATGSVTWNYANDFYSHWYNYYGRDDTTDPQDPKVNIIAEWMIQFFYFFLLHATFIPVSLYVSMTFARFFQSYFMNSDLEMYYELTDRPADVRTMTLNEELGQISHIFSDKTGTLTCNIMDFRKMSVNGKSYGLGITEIGKASWKLQGKEIPFDVLQGEERAKAARVPFVSFYDESYDADMKAGGLQKLRIQQFFRVLALCHDTIPERIDGKIKLSASNPDDEALVCAAKYFGSEFKDRQLKTAIVGNSETGEDEEIEVLTTIGFTSKRKRMSVIVRTKDGKLQMLIKGADTVMTPRLTSGQEALFGQTDIHMSQYAQEGLRCLLVAFKDVDEEYFQKWHKHYDACSTNLDELDKRKKGLPNTIEECENEMEQGFTLIGCTAIEDKLQDGVPECIACVAKAGVNIWVLTGDKEETAINIAVACNLVLPKKYMKQIVFNEKECPTHASMLALFRKEMKACEDEIAESGKLKLPRALIIDGPAMIDVMADESLKGLLLEFSQQCQAVVGCRVSPDQKREMVHLIKFGVPGVRTLSIGDGANDVAMIQEAHIGVGIRGEEGLQAVNAADYAIAQFRFLKPLLLKHGRNNYNRMSKLVIYMFYKNVLMSMCNFWFAWLNGFSGQKIYTEVGVQFYNLAYTSIPIIIIAVYDYDLIPDVVYTFPQLYLNGVKNEKFNVKLFWGNIYNSIFESVLLALIPLYAMNNSLQDGTLDTFWQTGALTYTAVICVVNIRVAFITEQWYFFHIFFLFASVGAWFFSATIVSVANWTLIDDKLAYYGMWHKLLRADVFWLTLFLLVVIITLKNSVYSLLYNIFNPSDSQIILEIECYGDGIKEDAISPPIGHAFTDEVVTKTTKEEKIFEANPAVEMTEGEDNRRLGGGAPRFLRPRSM
jgi:phospholipid-transporting ATPase